MANVRIAQIGQTAANRPIFEVMFDIRRYCFAVMPNGRVQFKPRAWLFSLGISSVLCNTYQDSINTSDAAALLLDSDQSTTREKFASQTYGTGFSWVPEYSVFNGWAKVFPSGSTTYNL